MHDDVTYHYAVDETIRRHFEKGLHEGNAQSIEELLPDTRQPTYLPTLEELVHIEMEFAWKKSGTLNERQPDRMQRVENYIERFPVLNSPDIVERLVKQEYQLRQRFGDQPRPEVYQQRFPNVVSAPTGQLLDGLSQKTAFPNVPGYQIVSVLGRGGMGIVYRAIQSSVNRPVALKMLSQAALVDGHALLRFRTEAEAVGKLRDAHIVQIYDVGEFDGRPYFSMELIDGQTLSEKIDGTPQSPRDSARLCRNLATSIQHAHDAGIVHRDMKPSNILIGCHDEVKIADFGLAKEVYSDSQQTETGELLGTASYMAPEQALGQRDAIGFPTDVYGIGAILYEMLTGQPPFRGTAVWDTIAMVKEQDPVPPRQLHPRVPRDLETICLKCLNKEPGRRYETAQQLADDLQRYLNDEPIRARRQSWVGKAVRWSRRNKPLSMTIAIASAIIILISSFAIANVVNERNRFRVQRNLAEDHLQESLIVSAKALVQARETDWFRQAWDNIEAAAAVENAQDRSAELRDIAVRCLAQPYLSMHVERTLVGHQGQVFTLDVSPDGRWLISGGTDGTIRIWKTSTGEQIGLLTGHRTPVVDVALHPAGRMLVSVDAAGAVLLWDLSSVWTESGDANSQSMSSIEPAILIDQGGRLLDISPSGAGLAIGMADGSVYLFDADDDLIPGETIAGNGSFVTALAYDRTGEGIAVARYGRTLDVYDSVTGEHMKSLESGYNSIALEYLVGPQELITADQENFGFSRYTPWIDDWVHLDKIHNNAITALESDAAGRVYAISLDGDIQVYQREGLRFEVAARGSYGAGYDLAIDPEHKWLAAAYHDGAIRIWRLTEPRVRQQAAPFHAGEFLPDTHEWVNCQVNVSRWEIKPGVEVGEQTTFVAPPDSKWSTHRENAWAMSVSSTGTYAATAAADATVKLWDVQNAELVQSFPVAPPAPGATGWASAFSHDETMLAGGAAELYLWDVETHELLARLPGHRALVFAIAFHPNNRLMVSAGNDGSIRLWDAQLGVPIEVLHQAERAYRDLAISPDGTTLVAVNEDYFVRTWQIDESGLFAEIDRQIAAGEKVPMVDIDQFVCLAHEVDDHRQSVYSVTYSPDGRFLVTGSEDGETIWFDPQEMKPVVRLQLATGQIRSISFSTDQKFMSLCSYGRPAMIWDLEKLHGLLAELGVDFARSDVNLKGHKE